LAIRVLTWTVALVILLEGSRTFYGAITRLHDPGHAGLLAWSRLVLSGSEIVAALLFLLPVTTVLGGYSLLLIIALAIAIHALHGDFRGLDILVLYGVAVFVGLSDRHDRGSPSLARIP
jgi:hypothetical protein